MREDFLIFGFEKMACVIIPAVIGKNYFC